MFACGRNTYGQLGLGDDEDRNTFTAVPALPDGKVAKQVVAGGGHTMILAEDGTVPVGIMMEGSSAWAITRTGTPSPRCRSSGPTILASCLGLRV